MPTYEYHCTSCNHAWEALYKIADRAKPESEACPSCMSLGYVEKQTLTAVPMGDPVRLGRVRPAGNVREVLQRVQERAPNATIKDHSPFSRI